MKSLLHMCRFFMGFEQPDSQVTDKEMALLLKHAHGAKVIVEIGCYEGKTTVELARNSNGIVYSIDPFFKGRLGICYGEWVARSHCRRHGLKNVEFLKGLSYEVARDFHDMIDLLFIDADHTYEAIKKDWEDWFPKVKNGGIVALHDCQQADNSPTYLGSMRFYDQDIPRLEGIKQVDAIDSLVIFQVG